MEANVTVTISTTEVLDLSVLLVEFADKPANRLVDSLGALPSAVFNAPHHKKASVFIDGLLEAELELSQVMDKIQQAKRIMEGLEQHGRTPVTDAASLEGFASFLGRLEEESLSAVSEKEGEDNDKSTKEP